MGNDPPNAALAAAWKLKCQLQSNAAIATARFRWLHLSQIFVAVAAALIGALACFYQDTILTGAALEVAAISFVALFSLGQTFQDGGYSQVLQTGSVAVERAIYLYRTVLQCTPERDPWLCEEIAEIQRYVGDALGQSWVMRPAPAVPLDSAQDWLPEDYRANRLLPQLEQGSRELMGHQRRRLAMRWAVYGCGLLWGMLPLLGPSWQVGIAAVAPLTLGLGFWLELLRINVSIERVSQTHQGLLAINNRWGSSSERDFFRLVLTAETVIAEAWPLPKQRLEIAMAPLKAFQPDLLEQIVDLPLPAELEAKIRAQQPALSSPLPEAEAALVPPATPSASNGKGQLRKLSDLPGSDAMQPRDRPHAFVVMPFGRKQAADGRWIDFNQIYAQLIKPCLEAAGFEAFRADEETTSGDILTDMFQELLLADLVIADLSIDNANVFYELGIRHALRKRGVVHIQAGRAYMPFDIFNVRTVPYHCDDSGSPDPQTLEKDRQAITNVIQSTWRSDRNLLHSPVFNLLSGLGEPERKSLRTPLATGYWAEYNTLQARIAIAQRQKRIGDVVLLAEEVSNPLIKEDIIDEAGNALKRMGNSALALKEYRQGLAINPDNTAFRCEEAYHLHRLGQSDEAIVKLERLLHEYPCNVDATSYLARIYKDMWRQQWVTIPCEQDRLQAAYDASHLLQKSIENYLRGYRLDQNQYYPGINALALTAILDHLVRTLNIASDDPDETNYRNTLPALEGSVQFCLHSTLQKNPNDCWAALSLGDLAVCTTGTPQQVIATYKKALTLLWNSKFTLQAALGQLQVLQLLCFRPEAVEAGITVLESELRRYERKEKQFALYASEAEVEKPPQVFLFAGHMIDKPGRAKPRFPGNMEAEATEKISAVLDKLDAHSHSIAITPGIACGGDIVFIEACLQRNMHIEVYLPFDTAEFIHRSVSFAGDHWVERFYEIVNHPNVTLHFQLERLGPVPAGDNAFERNNRWALYSTLMYDIDRVRLIVLWNGEGGDAPGGTGDMVAQVRQLGGIVEHIDTTKFDHWKQPSSKTIDSPQPRLEALLEPERG